jgi:hypothetical protein
VPGQVKSSGVGVNVLVEVGVPGCVGVEAVGDDNWIGAELGVEDWVGVKLAAGVNDGAGWVESAADEQATSIPTRTNTMKVCFFINHILTQKNMDEIMIIKKMLIQPCPSLPLSDESSCCFEPSRINFTRANEKFPRKFISK